MKKIISVLITLTLFLAMPAYGEKSKPLDDLKGPLEQGIAILKDPEYTSNREEQREKIWELVQKMFDFKAIAIRALARNWRGLSPEQQDEFTVVFTELLKNTYLDKIQGQFHDEEVVFEDQDMLSEDKAVVETKVIRQGNVEIPIIYSMHFKDTAQIWQVYDVNIEGVSLVKNYRNQFKSILDKDSPEDLIKRIREKNVKHEQDRKNQ